MTDKKIEHAQLNWRDEQPESTQFGDIYFSVEDGIAETEHVFIQSNQLPERLASLDKPMFTIGETGFGTGLNFLVARHHFLTKTKPQQTLHFISCEKYPMRLADLKRALKPIGAKEPFAEGVDQLVTLWPAALPGFHQLSFDNGRIQLWLLFGDAAQQLSQIDAKVDAWFLDGFAPSKNPEMWHDGLFKQLARLSSENTSFATFTSAGMVKRGLQSAGFEIKKIPGFGRKREMIHGHFNQACDLQSLTKPWLARPTPEERVSNCAVIGAGLAGASVAHALAKRGIQVDLYERAPKPATGGSGNPQGALYAKLPAVPTTASRVHANGLQFTVNQLKALDLNDQQHADLCGVLQLAVSEKDQTLQQKLIEANHYPESLVKRVSAKEASELAGTVTEHSALYFPDAGWASPPKLVNYLLKHDNIRSHFNCPIETLERDGSQWLINGEAYSQVVICSAYETELLTGLAKLDLKPIRGQTSWCSSEETPNLKTVVCGEGYVSPALNGQYCFGASFKVNDTSQDLKQAEHQHNLDLLQRALPELSDAVKNRELSGRAAQRAGTRDYLPMVGAVCDTEKLVEQYQRLSVDASSEFNDTAPWLEGLYVSVGHGSKGLITCPIAAEIIAAQITHQPYPLEQELIDILSPQRFAIRDLIRTAHSKG